MVGAERNTDDRHVSFTLITKVLSINSIAIVLRIFDASQCILTRRLDAVKSKDALYVYMKCRDTLIARGLVFVDDAQTAQAAA